MWVDYRGSLSTVYNDGGISTCDWIIEVHSVQSIMMEAHTRTHAGIKECGYLVVLTLLK